ncbi:uncharacterized protein C10orf67 homolog, mitochondrial [Amia ocellicauda]|uniref:uncharacterized protein C10orf67 homolog, mitochondrial n=1 Tax=Amia ocellicauda TaxID=2972642 RepID=UPI00346468A9
MDPAIHKQGHCHDEQEQDVYAKEIEDIARYSLGSQLRCGSFGRDACTQCDVSEIPAVKELAAVTHTLAEDMKSVKRDLDFQIKFLQTDYESKLQQQSMSLYTRMNEKVLALERQHKEKVAVLRKCYQQQLSDALVVLRTSYKKYYSRKDGNDQFSDTRQTIRLHELINEVQEKNALIESLSAQLKEYEEKELEQMHQQPDEDPEKERLTNENENLQNEIDTLHVEIERLGDSLSCSQKQLEHLGPNFRMLEEKAGKDEITIRKLQAENGKLSTELEGEKKACKNMLKKMKEDMEKEIESFQQSIKEQTLAQQDSKKKLAETEKEKQALIQQEEMLRRATQQKSATSGDQELLAQFEQSQKIEKQQRRQIESLKMQLDRANRTWEKKFEILKQSFHAIKDEMFLRQTLQRQAATLHHTSISYVIDTPGAHARNPGEEGLGTSNCASGLPLPDKSVRTSPQMDRTKDVIDVSVLSGAGTDAFTSRESQIMSEDEEEDASCNLPLPCPPSSYRQTTPHQVLH